MKSHLTMTTFGINTTKNIGFGSGRRLRSFFYLMNGPSFTNFAFEMFATTWAFFSKTVILLNMVERIKLNKTKPRNIIKPGCSDVLFVEMLTSDSVSLLRLESWLLSIPWKPIYAINMAIT